MTVRERLSWFVMPFKWIWRGCFDWEACGVAWLHAIGQWDRWYAYRQRKRASSAARRLGRKNK